MAWIFGALGKMEIDHLADHSIHRYIEGILKEIKKEDQRLSEGKGPVLPEDVAYPDKNRPHSANENLSSAVS